MRAWEKHGRRARKSKAVDEVKTHAQPLDPDGHLSHLRLVHLYVVSVLVRSMGRALNFSRQQASLLVRDDNLVQPASGHVLGRHVRAPVSVNVEGDPNLGHASRREWDPM